jgi:hypothetical protein
MRIAEVMPRTTNIFLLTPCNRIDPGKMKDFTPSLGSDLKIHGLLKKSNRQAG